MPTRSTKSPHPPEAAIDPVASAKAAGLRYVTDQRPGIRREKRGEDFVYRSVDGTVIEEAPTLDRIRAIGIPPAYTNVWVCPIANGHLQATGRDAKGRKQYRYHERWREVRDENKYERMLAFGDALPRIRERIEQDLSLSGMPRPKVLATLVRLLETTNIRVGNDEYARQNEHFGLTTLRNEHVDVTGAEVHFHFTGKSGKEHAIDLKDKRLAQIVKKCQDLPGQELFQYLDGDDQRHNLHSGDVNAYLHEIAGEEFTAKDFRTWAGTILCALSLLEFEAFEAESQAKKNITLAIKVVAERLGNTPTVCRKCYVHPAVLDAYLDGTMAQTLGQHEAEKVLQETAEHALNGDETGVLRLLRDRLSPTKTEPDRKAA